MCFQMVCYDSEQQEDYNTRYANLELYCKKDESRPPAEQIPFLLLGSLYPAADELRRQWPPHSDTHNHHR